VRVFQTTPAYWNARSVNALIANRVAESSRPEYVDDVRTRKLAIADGVGTVHGMYYDLASQYAIGLVTADLNPQ
jgi:hypothetical protein